MKVFYWYTILITLGMLISIPIFFIRERKDKGLHLLSFAILVLITFTEVYGRYLGTLKVKNALLYNINFVWIETVLLLWFLARTIPGIKLKKTIQIMGLLFVGFSSVNVLAFQPYHTFQSNSHTLGMVLIVGFCLVYFYKIMSQDLYMDRSLLSVPQFWINAFVLFFYATSFLFFISFQLLTDTLERQLILDLYVYVKIMSALLYLVMGLAFYAPLVFYDKSSNPLTHGK